MFFYLTRMNGQQNCCRESPFLTLMIKMDLTEVGPGRCNPSRMAALWTEAFLQVPHMPLRLISLLRALDVMKLACRTGVACLENAPQGDSLGFTHSTQGSTL